MKLKDAVAIVTGAGSGIGRATALALARRHATVFVCGRRSEALDETVAAADRPLGRLFPLVTDVTRAGEVRSMVAQVLRATGRVDVLVNAAGVAVARPAPETTEADWDIVLDTNLKGPFLCSQAVLPGMIAAGRGVIVNVSSVLGLAGLANFGAYCASKFGLVGLTEALADECRRTGVRIFAVCPGRTATAMQRQLGGDELMRLSMPPDRVAATITNLVEREPSRRSGIAVVVDDQRFAMRWYETRRAWRRLAARVDVPGRVRRLAGIR